MGPIGPGQGELQGLQACLCLLAPVLLASWGAVMPLLASCGAVMPLLASCGAVLLLLASCCAGCFCWPAVAVFAAAAGQLWCCNAAAGQLSLWRCSWLGRISRNEVSGALPTPVVKPSYPQAWWATSTSTTGPATA